MDTPLSAHSKPGESWRERKKNQTRSRIASAGLQLFLEQGFEATTLDEIAQAAGIARRTFFHYFDSKENLLIAFEDEAERAFRVALAATPKTTPPFEAMSRALLGMVSSFDSEEARAIDRLMRSTEALRARRQANYERLEKFVSAALSQRWPNPADQQRLQIIAMVGIGVMRIGADRWSANKRRRSIEQYLKDGLTLVSTKLSS